MPPKQLRTHLTPVQNSALIFCREYPEYVGVGTFNRGRSIDKGAALATLGAVPICRNILFIICVIAHISSLTSNMPSAAGGAGGKVPVSGGMCQLVSPLIGVASALSCPDSFSDEPSLIALLVDLVLTIVGLYEFEQSAHATFQNPRSAKCATFLVEAKTTANRSGSYMGTRLCGSSPNRCSIGTCFCSLSKKSLTQCALLKQFTRTHAS